MGLNTSKKSYWSYLLINIRVDLEVTQEELAIMLKTKQSNISRWERGLSKPSRALQDEIEKMATKLGLSTVNQIDAVVTYSPFNMILVSKEMKIVAMSGLAQSMISKPNHPIDLNQIDVLSNWAQAVNFSSFWEERMETIEITARIGHLKTRTIIIPVFIQGEKYALAQIE